MATIATVILTLLTHVRKGAIQKKLLESESEIEEVPEVESEDEFEIISNTDKGEEAMTSNQENQPEETVEMITQTEESREETAIQNPIQEGEEEKRKIYVTKAGEKYHLNRGCDPLRGYRSYERKACEVCKERTQRTLTFNPNGRRPQSETELGFIHENEEYHDEGRTRWTSQRRKGKRPA